MLLTVPDFCYGCQNRFAIMTPDLFINPINIKAHKSTRSCMVSLFRCIERIHEYTVSCVFCPYKTTHVSDIIPTDDNFILRKGK